MTVAEFVGKLGLDLDEAEFNKGNVALLKIENALLALGGIVAGATVALGVMVKGLADQAAAANDAATAIGIDAAALQELGYAASQSGSSAEELQAALGFLTKNAAAAAGGSKEAAEGFARLGISVRDASGQIRPADALLAEASDRFRAMPDGIAKSSLAMDVFGKSGRELLPFLNQGSDAIAGLRQEAQDLGIVLGADVLAAGGKLNNSMGRLFTSLGAVRTILAGPLLVPVRLFVDELSEWWRINHAILGQRWDEFLGRLAPIAHVLAGALLTAGDALGEVMEDGKKLGEVIYWARFAFLALAAAALVAAGPMIGTAISFASAWIVAAAPILLIGLLIAAVADDIYQFATGGESLIGDVIGTLKEMGPVLGAIVAVVGVLTGAWLAANIAAQFSAGLAVLMWAVHLNAAVGAAARVAAAWLRSAVITGGTWALQAALAVESAAMTAWAWARSAAGSVAAAARAAGAWVASAARSAAAGAASAARWVASTAITVASATAGALASAAAWVGSAAASGAAWLASAALAIPSLLATGAAAVLAGAMAAGAAIAAGATAAAAWIAATWPILLLIAIVGALAYQIYQFATGGESLIGDLIYIFEELWISIKDGAVEAWDAVVTEVTEAMVKIRNVVRDADTWREVLGGVGEVLYESIMKGLRKIPGPLLMLLGPIGSAVSAAIQIDEALGGDNYEAPDADAADSGLLVRGFVKTAQSGGVNAAFGGGASPAAVAGSSSSTVSNARTVNANATFDVKITGAPGQSAESVGGAAAEAMRDGWQGMLSDAHATGGV